MAHQLEINFSMRYRKLVSDVEFSVDLNPRRLLITTTGKKHEDRTRDVNTVGALIQPAFTGYMFIKNLEAEGGETITICTDSACLNPLIDIPADNWCLFPKDSGQPALFAKTATGSSRARVFTIEL